MDSNKAVENTDVELYREKANDYYAPAIFLTIQGTITIDVGGTVYTMPLRDWHALAKKDFAIRRIQGDYVEEAGYVPEAFKYAEEEK